ncbi:hypothetical protein AB1395_02045 [Streptococcus pluranimalium]|uniref:hypothetical protein n=1 Tax=Streptococcus pluranimalium TaxID=82348 RepID=UPI001C4CD9D7|nr:hypothetical protein [Streptococcus pluranimalium]MDY3042269.1 hypothetical protein [Streptococcus pluranimalium]WFM80236.1 hypothetical protein P7F70_02145 [Streptococcus pluranimalium]
MSSRRRAFPLIPDDEPVIGQSTAMRLYDNDDLITNINGTYYDKDYSDVTPSLQFVPKTSNDSEDSQSNIHTELDQGRTYAEQAREDAKNDLRQKRQFYVNHELQRAKQPSHSAKTGTALSPSSSKREVPSFQKKGSVVKKPAQTITKTKVFQKDKASEHTSELAAFSKNLHQETYILVDLPKVYNKPENQKDSKPKKNTFDFLKRSQIYNHQERQEKRERQIAQELNLTRFED